MTGPKISSRTMPMSSSQRSNTVGATNQPLRKRPVVTRSPPTSTRAPGLAALLDVAEHLLHVRFRDQRADLRRRIERIADLQRAHARQEARDEVLRDRSVHEHARAVRAHLARRIEIAEQRARHRVVEIGIVEDDDRRFAAELERHLLERRRGIAITAVPLATDPVSDTLRICGWRVSRRPVSAGPCTHLEQSGGQAGLRVNLLQLHRGQRRQVGRLEQHRVAAGQRRRRLPAGDLQRIVPGADARDDAERLAARVAEGAGAQVQVLAGDRRRDAGEILEAVGARDHVDDSRFLDRLAGVARLEFREFVVARRAADPRRAAARARVRCRSTRPIRAARIAPRAPLRRPRQLRRSVASQAARRWPDCAC